jgi:GxxExxY protein
MQDPEINKLSSEIIDSSIKIHRNLGPGLLESVYQQCLIYELNLKNIQVASEVSLPIKYESIKIENAYRLDLLVENRIIVEIKSVEKIMPVHEAQTLSYLKLSGLPLALLINFRVDLLKNGIKRYAN